jgi:hypothetical protein
LADLILNAWVSLTALIIGIFFSPNLANGREFSEMAAGTEVTNQQIPLGAHRGRGCVAIDRKANYKLGKIFWLPVPSSGLRHVLAARRGMMWRGRSSPSFQFEPGCVTIFVVISNGAPWMPFYQQSSVVDRG